MKFGDTMKKVVEVVKPNRIIPIHTTNKNRAKEIFKNTVILDDKEEMEI